MNLSNSLGRFRLVALLEGWSYLILLFIAMPFKYIAGYDALIRPVGMAHGILFVAYALLLIMAAIEQKWSLKLLFFSALVSFIPFGTFYGDKHWWVQDSAN
jgi:integral membrane protein